MAADTPKLRAVLMEDIDAIIRRLHKGEVFDIARIAKIGGSPYVIIEVEAHKYFTLSPHTVMVIHPEKKPHRKRRHIKKRLTAKS